MDGQVMTRLLRTEDTFPLFDVELTLTNDQRAVVAYVSFLVPLTHKPDGWRHLYREYRRLEHWCWHDGVVGWYCACQIDNLPMQRWLTALGATPYQIDGNTIFFHKALLQNPTEEAQAFGAFVRQQTHRRAANG